MSSFFFAMLSFLKGKYFRSRDYYSSLQQVYVVPPSWRLQHQRLMAQQGKTRMAKAPSFISLVSTCLTSPFEASLTDKIDYADHVDKNKGAKQKAPLVPQSIADRRGPIAEMLAAGVKHANREKRRLAATNASVRKRGRGAGAARSPRRRHTMAAAQGSVSCSSFSPDPSELLTASRKPL